ncbi:long-chain fatty acid--CoA ligase [Streptomyces canus]|uniref:long-chain-fatty-acid--CoA ligase n=1 Tax=Streptomyces canus TaxID=58343 RepID=UPI00037E5726|nr:long-chain fatty acid--CoA ligase [Streptomyces canus]
MPQFNLASLLDDSVKRYAERTALVLGPHRLNYADLGASTNRVANLLVARGIKPGDSIALMCPNLPQFTIAYFAILKVGATVVPLNVLLKRGEVRYHLEEAGAKALLAFEGTPELPVGAEAVAAAEACETSPDVLIVTADPAAASGFEGIETLAAAAAGHSPEFDTVSTDEDDIAVVLFTSGTSGRPKGAELRHRNMRDNALAARALFDIDPSRPDTYLGVLPLFHSFGQSVVQNAAVANGGTVVMLPRFEAASALASMLRESVTFFAGVPTMYWAMLHALDETVDGAGLAARLRVAVAGGSALPIEIHREFEARLGVTIAEGYGLSETSPVTSFSRLGEPVRPGSIGIPLPGVEMTLLKPGSWHETQWTPDAVGEIAVRGHNVFRGYRGRPDATAEVLRDGWLRTGDLARRDEDGWYYIVDRAKDLIIRGGFNVYPREVEESLMTHPDVSLAAVVGVPHDSHGEEIKAFVVAEPGAELKASELIDWAKAHMASYKYPRLVEIVGALPMTATGKILKRELH